MAKQAVRSCGNCGGKVFLVRKEEKIEHPARDERGRSIYEQKFNKQTGQMEEHQVMVPFVIQGLGTWHCANGCKDRTVKVVRFTGAGKEVELEAKGKDRVPKDEHMPAVSVQRHILVVTA